jgi:GNAT superfamily N-acetyltransferase
MEHWRELALNQDSIKLDPDWNRFYALDIQNILRILTVRVEGQLVGYVFLLFGPHLHYASTPWSHGDMFWLDPVYRQGWTGVKLFKALIRGVEEMGGKMLTVPVKLHFMNARVIKLLERLGFKQIEVIMAKRIG